MSLKIIRDPLFNYIAIDTDRDRWLLDLLDSPEVQRLRRIHQLGVSEFTYPGASHTRLSHTLGVLHLMQLVCQRLEQLRQDERVKTARPRLLAAAVLHDVGHGPFSHLFEPCLDFEHEEWSVKIIRDENGCLHKLLSHHFGESFPGDVAQLIEKNNFKPPQWQKSLLSSQLDVDRMDYLRRDSLFTGSGYGHFDWYRLVNTIQLYGSGADLDIVWPEKAKFAIEEYVFARYYMYQNVYLHKTTRGFEKMLEAMWKLARKRYAERSPITLLPAIRAFLDSKEPTAGQYLAIEESTVLHQIQEWQCASDKALGDLARRFLRRNKFVMIEPPIGADDRFENGHQEWKDALEKLVAKAGYQPVEAYCLCDTLQAKYYQPYFPEKEDDEQSAKNAIRILVGDSPVEISQRLPRLGPITAEKQDRYRYYVPDEIRENALRLTREWPQA